MASSTPIILAKKSQEGIISFHKQCYGMLNQSWSLRDRMLSVDLAYARELDRTKENTRAKIANRYGDSSRFQNVTVPVVMPQVEAAVTYQSSVFLTGSPIFGMVAPPGQEDAALQYQAILEENSIRGGWIRHFQMFFRDAFKYNIAAVEVDWAREVTQAIETDVTFMSGQEGRPKEVIWQGNRIQRWDMYNTFFDARCAPTEIYKDGEFVGTTTRMSRIKLKQFIQELPDKMIANIVPAFESGLAGSGVATFYVPTVNPTSLLEVSTNGFDWGQWAQLDTKKNSQAQIQYKNSYEVTTLYARILPSDFDIRVPSANTPQVWKFIVVNHQVLIYAERQTNAHGWLPVLFGQANEDGLTYQTKSLANNAEPFQSISSALVNSAMAARRRAISDRTLYDPSRVSEAHINSDNPSAKIPVRPAAYGKPVGEAVYPFPYRDDQSATAFQILPQMANMANMVNGQNQAKQGQFVKGNKTLHEYDSVMSNANGRDQLTAMLFEAQVFTPLKHILKLNIMQFQAGVSIFTPTSEVGIQIDPVELRKSQAVFKVTDGLTPTDKVISSDEFAVALQTIASSPGLGAGYNLAPAFSYLMKTRNVDFTPFEKSPQQMAYEQALGSWQSMTQLALEKGAQFNQSQPQPAQYGYIPGAPVNQQGTPAAASAPNPGSQPQPSTPQ